MKTTPTGSFQQKLASQRTQIFMKSLHLGFIFFTIKEKNGHLHPIFYEGLLSFPMYVCMLQAHEHCTTNTKYGPRHCSARDWE